MEMREKQIDLKGLFKDFFGTDSSNEEKKNEANITKWEEENKADLSKANKDIASLEKMLVYQNKNKKPGKQSRLKTVGKNKEEGRLKTDISRSNREEINGKEREIGE